MTKKKKILTISDHPLFSTGVAIQTRLFIESMLQTDKYDFISLAGAVRHADTSPIRTEQYGDRWKIFPIEGYGNEEVVRSVIRTERPDILWLMTDPRYWTWLWNIEDEIRAQVPMVYYHVWDNEPAPLYNRKFYDSNDVVVSASKLTERLVEEVGTTAEHVRIPHTFDPAVFKKLPTEEVQAFKSEYFGDLPEGKKIFFWNNRNTLRKNPTTMLWWFKEFLNEVGEDKACLLVHTDPNEPTGTNLEENLSVLGLNNGQVMISPLKYPPDKMAMLYNVADCTINIADAEGFGLSTLESLACGTPIIASNTGGLAEQVTDGEQEFGVKIEPSTRTVIGSHKVPYIYQDRISKEDFISALKKIVDMSDSEREELGMNGMKHAYSQYNLDSYAEKWGFVIDNVINNCGSWGTRKHKGWEVIEL